MGPAEVDPIAPWGVMVPNFNPFGLDPWPYLEVVTAVEEAGFDAGWVGDHLSFHPPIMEATAALAAAAAVTTRLRLGFAVLLAAMRPPVWLAKTIVTLDQLAPGRLIMGVGAGGEHPPEWEAAGVDPTHRGRRLDELLALWPDLVAGHPVAHASEALTVQSPGLSPGMAPPPPLVVGGRSEAALRRAARFADGWLGVWLSPSGLARSRERLAELATQQGRPAPEPMLLAFVAVGDDDAACRADAARLYQGQYDLDYEQVERWTLTGSVEAVVDALGSYREAGARSLALIPCRPDLVGQVEALAEVRHRLDP